MVYYIYPSRTAKGRISNGKLRNIVFNSAAQVTLKLKSFQPYIYENHFSVRGISVLETTPCQVKLRGAMNPNAAWKNIYWNFVILERRNSVLVCKRRTKSRIVKER